jgi:hypothetical protein
MARPVTVQVNGPEVQVQDWPPLAGIVVSAATTVYWVMGEPPSKAGGVQATVTLANPGVTDTMVGGSGTVAGVAWLDAPEVAPCPTALTAVTVNE